MWHAKEPSLLDGQIPNTGQNLQPFTGNDHVSKISEKKFEWDEKPEIKNNKQTNKLTLYF